jgi:DNA-3-methyladenine glycosylase
MSPEAFTSSGLPFDGPLLDAAFFARTPDVVGPDLLGAVIVSTVDGVQVGGRIVETEAYLGSDDAGSHAATRGITKRNATMYGPPGTAYVYFTYGNHHMINLVCDAQGTAGAVLIRAIEPLIGIDVMTARRRGLPLRDLANGPGKLAAALGVDLSDNGSTLGVGRLAVYHGQRPTSAQIALSGRIGLSSGHELELRWYVRDSAFVSRGRIGPARQGRASRKGVAE